MRGQKLRSVNWKGVLGQKGIKQGLGTQQICKSSKVIFNTKNYLQV
jgi:hypothetical protein